MKIIKIIILIIFSVIISLSVLAFSMNYYLKAKGLGQESKFLKWTLYRSSYSPRYIFWDISYCQRKPQLCQFEEEKYAYNKVEIFRPEATSSCEKKAKILFLGDSFVDSPWTNEGQSFPAVFSKEYSQYKNVCVYLIRLTTPGSGNDQQFAVFSSRISHLKPDIVIWQFFYNDLFENIKQAIFNPVHGELERKPTITNTVFLAGYLNQNIPFFSKTTLGKHIMFLAEFMDVFGNWPLTFENYQKVVNYNKEKISLMLKEAKNMSEVHGFELYTTLAPLECQISKNIGCNQLSGESQNDMREILTEHSEFISMQNLQDQHLSVLGVSTNIDKNGLFETKLDKNPPGERHLSKQGNIIFGNILFENFLTKKLFGD